MGNTGIQVEYSITHLYGVMLYPFLQEAVDKQIVPFAKQLIVDPFVTTAEQAISVVCLRKNSYQKVK